MCARWAEQEIETLHEMAEMYSLEQIAFRLKRRGYYRTTSGRVAGLYRYNPAPSEPDLRLATHPAQASHKLQIVPECIC